jgi:hypothetical protein
VIILLGPNDPPLFVGALPQIPNHPLLCDDRAVYLTHERFEHIKSQRRRSDDSPSAFVFRHLALVISQPALVGALTPDPRKVEIYGHVPADVSSGVCVSLKCLDGETWINTAFPMGVRVMMKHFHAGRLRPLETFLTQ